MCLPLTPFQILEQQIKMLHHIRLSLISRAILT